MRNETARGFLLLGVFFIHGLYSITWDMNDWHQAPISFSLIKILAPQISIYFFLSGISMRSLGKKSLRAVLPNSVMLIFLAWVSEGLGIAVENLLYGGFGTGALFLRHAVKPMIYGTGGCTFVTWFFTVLAAGRLFAWLFERNKLIFAASWAVLVLLILLGKRLHLPDNLWEWRNWPAATLFIVIGMKLPRDWRVPRWLGLAGLAGGLVLTWFDVPGMWKTAPCLTCHIDFVAEPMVGSYGFLPVFLIEQLLFFFFMLWAAQNPPAWLGAVGRYFGRASLQFLLLHGWLIISLIPAITSLFPPHESVALVLGILLLNPPLHAAIFRFTENALNRVIAGCFDYGRSVTGWSFRLAEAGQARLPGRRLAQR